MNIDRFLLSKSDILESGAASNLASGLDISTADTTNHDNWTVYPTIISCETKFLLSPLQEYYSERVILGP